MNHILIHSRSEERTPKSILEMKFMDPSADTEWIKYSTNRIRTGSLESIDLLKVKRRRIWIQWSNKIQQHVCWSPVNHCYKCAKQKVLQAEMRNKIRYKIAVLCGSLLKVFKGHSTWIMEYSSVKSKDFE